MKRNTIFASLLLALISCVYAAEDMGAGALPGESRGYLQKQVDRGYTINFPKSWLTAPGWGSANDLYAYEAESETEEIQANIYIWQGDPSRLNLEQFFSASIAELMAYTESFTINKVTDKKVAGLAAKRLVFSHVMDGRTFKVVQYYIIDKGTAYIITGNSLQDRYPQYEPTFDHVAGTFRITP